MKLILIFQFLSYIKSIEFADYAEFKWMKKLGYMSRCLEKNIKIDYQIWCHHRGHWERTLDIYLWNSIDGFWVWTEFELAVLDTDKLLTHG